MAGLLDRLPNGSQDVRMETPKTPSAALAAAVRRHMEGQGVTLTALAEGAAIPLTTLHRRFNAPDSAPFRWDELHAIASVLGTSVQAFAAEAAA